MSNTLNDSVAQELKKTDLEFLKSVEERRSTQDNKKHPKAKLRKRSPVHSLGTLE